MDGSSSSLAASLVALIACQFQQHEERTAPPLLQLQFTVVFNRKIPRALPGPEQIISAPLTARPSGLLSAADGKPARSGSAEARRRSRRPGDERRRFHWGDGRRPGGERRHRQRRRLGGRRLGDERRRVGGDRRRRLGRRRPGDERRRLGGERRRR